MPSTFASTEPHASLEALVEVELDQALIRLRTFTLHAAARWLRRLIVRALARGDYKAGGGDSAAAAVQRAVATFCGSEVWADADAERMTGCVFARVSAAMHSWTEASALPNRHRIFSRRVAAASPDVLTLVEYCDAWRREPLPTAPGREYRAILGSGTAAILFDVRRYEEVELAMKGVDADRHIMNSSLGMGRVVRSMRERGDAISVVEGGGMNPIDEAPWRPNRHASRCCGGWMMLFLVAACHFESGSLLTRKGPRAAAMRTTSGARTSCGAYSACLSLLGGSGDVAIVFAGDQFRSVKSLSLATRMPLLVCRCGECSASPTAASAGYGSHRHRTHPRRADACGLCGGGLILRCDGCDGARLLGPALSLTRNRGLGIGGGGGRTRAGASMVIDYIFVGSARSPVRAGERESVAGDGGELLPVAARAPLQRPLAHVQQAGLRLPSGASEDTARAAHEALGLRHAIMHWGSDPPVACEICIAASSLGEGSALGWV